MDIGTTPNTIANDLVTFNETEGTITTTSRITAATYGKRHGHVIRDIENLMADIDALESQEELPTRPKFGLSEYQDESGKTNKMYLLDRNAWTMLVMGYTGPNATRFKLRYIAAFDAMEAKLKEIAESTIKKLEEQWDCLQIDLTQKYTPSQAAAQIGIGVREMTSALRNKGYFEKIKYNNNEPAKFLAEGKLIFAEDEYWNQNMSPDHHRRQTYITWGGIQWIRGVLENIRIEKGLVVPPKKRTDF